MWGVGEGEGCINEGTLSFPQSRRNVSCGSPSNGFLFGRSQIVAHYLHRKRRLHPKPASVKLLQVVSFSIRRALIVLAVLARTFFNSD